MIFDDKPTSEITAEQIRALVTDAVQEDAFLEYKAMPYPHTPDGIHELVKDVSAFANAQGGYLIMGIGPHGDDPRRPGGYVNVENSAGERQRMIDHCLEKIEPRLPVLDISVIDVDDRSVLVCRVPESAQKPHCAWPDGEHHYFWRRYEDGNRLMTTAEIRECMESNRVYRELAELRREFEVLRKQTTAAREVEMGVDEGNLFQLTSPEAFLQYVEGQFLSTIGNEPYFRLTATPLPLRQLNLRDRVGPLYDLLMHPPQLRPNGFDIAPVMGTDFRRTALGLIGTDNESHHFRLLWNGHLEYWTAANGMAFNWEHMNLGEAANRFLPPTTMVESTACFVLLVRQLCHIVEHTGQLRFGLGLHGIRGRYLIPYPPGTLGHMRFRNETGHEHGPPPFNGDHLLVGPVTANATNLPGTVAWDLISQVYYRFGYTNEQIPLFDNQHRCILGLPRDPAGGATP